LMLARSFSGFLSQRIRMPRQRLARHYERLPQTLAGLHFLVFTCLMLAQAVGHIIIMPQRSA
jgi:hypothetical protein